MSTENVAQETATVADSLPENPADRIAAIEAQVRGEAPSLRSDTESVAEEAPAVLQEEKPKEEVSERARERQARLEALRAAEAKSFESRKEKETIRELQSQLKLAQESQRAFEQQMAELNQISKNPALIFDLAERYGTTAEDVANALRERIESPDKYATKMAQQEIDPKIAALEARLEAFESRAREEKQAIEMARAEETAKAEFFNLCESSNAPKRVAALIGTPKGQNLLYTLATQIVPTLPRGATLEDVIYEVDSHLEGLESYASAFAPKQQQVPARPSLGGKTVDNSLQSTRTQDSDSWDKLTPQERIRAIEAQVRAGG